MTRSVTKPRPPVRARRTSVFEKLAGWSYQHRLWALLLWVGVLVGVTVGAQTIGGATATTSRCPAPSRSRRWTCCASTPRPGPAPPWRSSCDPGGGERASRSAVEAMLAEVRALPHVVDVGSPYADATAISPDGTIGYATVTLDGQAEEVPPRRARGSSTPPRRPRSAACGSSSAATRSAPPRRARAGRPKASACSPRWSSWS